MIRIIKKQLGYIKRGGLGIVQNYLDQPGISTKVNTFQIGFSGKQQPIDVYKFGGGSTKILIVGGIHGNEIGSIKAAKHLINWLAQNSTQYRNCTFYIIPCLNVGGYNQALKNPDYLHGGLIGRFNNNNVDLNRNFETPSFQSQSVWSRGKNYSEQTNVYCGERAFSEPETQALLNLINEEQIKIYISLHNTAADVMGSNNEQGKQLAQIFSKVTNYSLVTHEDWVILNQTGTAKEWCDSNNITYLEIEGRYRWSSDWPVHLQGLKAVFLEVDKF